MLKLPTEVINRIVRYNKDSVRTILSCMEIFKTDFFKNDNIGIILLTDDDSTNIYNIFNFKILIDDSCSNLLHWPVNYCEITDTKALKLKQFLSSFDHLLIVIFTETTYNENLTVCMNQICYSCSSNTTISVFYKTPINYVSTLYFNEFRRKSTNLNMSELYIIGNAKITDSVCDIDTLFQYVYLLDIKCCYSVQINNQGRKLVASDLITIRKLTYNSNINVSDVNAYLRFCPKLSNIDSMKFPISNTLTKSNLLPSSDNIYLNDFNSEASYSQIDGSLIKKSLTLSTTLRSINADFKYLNFPNITKLTCNSSQLNLQPFSFTECQFDNLIILECNNSIIPWNCLNFPKDKILDEVTIKLTNMKQLMWISECPFRIKLIKLFFKNGFSMSNGLQTNDIKFNMCDEIFVELQELQFCILLNKIIIPNLNDGTIKNLSIKINENNLKKSILENDKTYSKTGVSDYDEIKFKLANLEKLTLILDNKDFLNNTIESLYFHERLQRPNNPFQDLMIPGYSFYSIAPSQFRKNSLAGLSDTDARKQSIISIESNYERRLSLGNKSDVITSLSPGLYYDENAIDDSYDDFISIDVITKIPKIIKTDLVTLESGILNVDVSAENNKLSTLQIILEPQIKSVNDLNEIEIELVDNIIRIFQFPFNLNLPYLHIDTLQIIVNMQPFESVITLTKRLIFLAGVEKRLILKDYPIRVLDNLSNIAVEKDQQLSILLQY